MITHKLKTDPIYFDKMWNGTKKSELRENDRGFRQGDQVLLEEYDREKHKFTGRSIPGSISYVTDYPDALRDGYVMLCLSLGPRQESFLP